jgi:hypothetical protein
MLKGEYLLTLSCDSKEQCDEWEYFSAPSKMEAKAKAVSKGWMFRLRSKRCICPTHAKEVRDNNYRPREKW